MAATAEKSKEAELKTEVGELKARLSGAENANNLLSRDLAAAQKSLVAANAKADQAKALEQTVANLNAQLSRTQADLTSANAKAARAEVILDGLRGFKSVLDAA
jgi:hypothetical protein